MNPRIQELVKQSGGEFWQRMGSDGVVNPEAFVTFDPPESVTKFAELIVKECCSKLVEMGEGWHEFARNPPDGQAHNAGAALFAAYRLKEDAVDEICEHFGVEE